MWTPGQLADAWGNKDGELTGIERELASALGKLPDGAACALRLERSSAGEGYRRGTIRAHELRADVRGLSCSRSEGKPPGPRGASLTLTRVPQGFRLGASLTVEGGGARPLALQGALEPTREEPRPLPAIASHLQAAAETPACRRFLREEARSWGEALSRGRCLVARLERHTGWGEAHREPPGNPCSQQIRLALALDLAAAQRCSLTGPEARLAQRLDFFLGRAPYSEAWVELVEPGVDPVAGSGLHAPAGFDQVRWLELAEALWRQGRRAKGQGEAGSPAARRAGLEPAQTQRMVDLWRRTPLGLRRAALKAAAQAPRLQSPGPRSGGAAPR